MAWYLNHYTCARCDRDWSDEWSCMCDDDCPHCGARHMSPTDSDDLTEVIVENDGKPTPAGKSEKIMAHSVDRVRKHWEKLPWPDEQIKNIHKLQQHSDDRRPLTAAASP